MAEQIVSVTDESVRARQQRRAELLQQRQRAAEQRRRRGFGLRLPVSQPLVRVADQLQLRGRMLRPCSFIENQGRQSICRARPP